MDNLEEEFQKKLDEIKNNPSIVTKYAIKTVVGHCAGAIVAIAIHTIVPKDMLTRKQKIKLSVAAWAMGGAVSDRAGTWAAEESLTSTVLCAITDQFKKPEKKVEVDNEETIKPEEALPE